MSRPTATLGISSHPVLNAADCNRAWELLLQNRPHWIERHIPGAGEAGVFHTLGRASYIDVSASPDPERDYYSAVQRSNAIIHHQFHWLLDRVRLLLADVLQAPVECLNGLALPGFHIFDGAMMGSRRKARAHFDLQYAALRFPTPPDPETVLSFTLPILLPVSGGGLDVWNVTHKEFLQATLNQPDVGPEAFVRGWRKRTVRYRPGRLVLQRHHILHRIASTGPTEPSDRRVTLQGHGVRFGNRWGLYW